MNLYLLKIISQKCSYDKKTKCLLWTGYRLKDGYGRKTFKNKQYLVHRLAKYFAGEMTWQQLHSKNNVVMHTCDNPPCINLMHLVLATQRENIKDRSKKGRTAKHLNRRDNLGRFK